MKIPSSPSYSSPATNNYQQPIASFTIANLTTPLKRAHSATQNQPPLSMHFNAPNSTTTDQPSKSKYNSKFINYIATSLPPPTQNYRN